MERRLGLLQVDRDAWRLTWQGWTDIVSNCVKISPLTLPRLNPLTLPRSQVRQDGLISMREKDLVVTIEQPR